jgi:hypothetical protein
MTRRARTSQPTYEILDRLRADINALSEATAAQRPSATVRRRLDADIRDLIERMDVLSSELDPVRQPRFMFDPGNPAVVGRFVALAMIGQPRIPLSDVEQFYGSGIYALYYKGDFGAYAPISGTETPIYVGKADPQADTAKTPTEQGTKLLGRLKEHLRSIKKASNTLDLDDFERRALVVQSGWQGAAEEYLIRLFKPVWNKETDICYGIGKHGDAPSTRGNKRSPWDTIHLGRDWAHRDPNMVDAQSKETIMDDVRAHFLRVHVFRDMDDVLRSFLEELRQL